MTGIPRVAVLVSGVLPADARSTRSLHLTVTTPIPYGCTEVSGPSGVDPC